jgi:DNA-binding transcriptional regulator GbsR (MarR family)
VTGRLSSPRAAASRNARVGALFPFNPIASVKPLIAPSNSVEELADFERDCIDLFVHAAQLLSIPRSVGEIYGLLYASPSPLSMDAIMERLDMSKGSVSQGLRWLRDIGAVRSTYITGDRRDHFAAETQLRKLASGFLQERINPHLQNGDNYIERLAQDAAKIRGSHRNFVNDRLSKVRSWHRIAKRVVPLFLRITGRI